MHLTDETCFVLSNVHLLDFNFLIETAFTSNQMLSWLSYLARYIKMKVKVSVKVHDRDSYLATLSGIIILVIIV